MSYSYSYILIYLLLRRFPSHFLIAVARSVKNKKGLRWASRGRELNPGQTYEKVAQPYLDGEDRLMVDIAELHHDPVADLVDGVEAEPVHPLQDGVAAAQRGQRALGLQHHGRQRQVPGGLIESI